MRNSVPKLISDVEFILIKSPPSLHVHGIGNGENSGRKVLWELKSLILSLKQIFTPEVGT